MNIQDISIKNYFVFDAFGTLFKTSEVKAELKKIAGEKTDNLIRVWRNKQLQYTWLRNEMNQYEPFSTPQLIDGAKDLLKTLKDNGKTVAILSNGTRSMLDNGVQLTGIQYYVDHILSVDDIGIYKPQPAVYQMALDKLVATVEDLIFFSSNQWDVSGASVFGLDACWINQYGETKEGLPFGDVVEVSSLKEIKLFFTK